ncbi:MAG TPA: 50S ribosomal protein L30 [Syntrophales bacterium]|nr:50S ribosomal protein L30 [Syntrophales bacterium]
MSLHVIEGIVDKKLKITQVKSYIGRPQKQRQILRGMGLGKLNRTVLLEDTPEIRGMIMKVNHLVVMEEFTESKV